MNIGYLKPATIGTPPELFGEIKTLNFQEEISLVLFEKKAVANAPDYKIYARGDIEIGAAWKKTKQQIDGAVLEFLSITIDDPSMPHPLNVAAFKKDDGCYDITWRRRQNSQNDAAQNAA